MVNSIKTGRLNISFYLPGEERPKDLILPKQVHGTKIVNVVTGDEDLSGCDGLITDNLSLTLGIESSDCAPICFFDGRRMGIAHVGWRGFCGGMIEKMLLHFDIRNLEIYVGPFLHSFEIKKDFCYDAVVAKVGTNFLEAGDIIRFDFKKAIESVLPVQAFFDERNTQTSSSFPSFRRDKRAGNFITAINVNGRPGC